VFYEGRQLAGSSQTPIWLLDLASHRWRQPKVPPALAATACEAVIADAAIRTSVNLSLPVLRFFVPVSADDAHGPLVSITGNLAFQSNTMPLVHPVIATVTVLFHSADTVIPLTIFIEGYLSPYA